MPLSRRGTSPRHCLSARWRKVRRPAAGLRRLGRRHLRGKEPKARKGRSPREKVRVSIPSHRRGVKFAMPTILSGSAVTVPVADYTCARRALGHAPSTCTRPSSRRIFRPRARVAQSPMRALDGGMGGWPSCTYTQDRVTRPASSKASRGSVTKQRSSCTWRNGTF